jgi:hypothetical protein
MNIPENANVTYDDPIYAAWKQEAIKIGIETGIYVSVSYDYTHYPHIKRIYFVALDKEFEDITSLRKTINLKAFL